MRLFAQTIGYEFASLKSACDLDSIKFSEHYKDIECL